jgi:hypothetical protein
MYTCREAAKILGVAPNTIHGYVSRKDHPLKAARRGIRHDIRIREDDLIKFAEQWGMMINLPSNGEPATERQPQ